MDDADPISKLAKFRALSSADRRLFLAAIWWLLFARLLLAFIPFRRLTERLGSEAVRVAGEDDPDFVARVGFAVARAADNVPWRSDCFPQTIAACKILKRHGISSTIHLGVERVGNEELNAHAWLTSGNNVVTGGANLERYTEMHQIKA